MPKRSHWKWPSTSALVRTRGLTPTPGRQARFGARSFRTKLGQRAAGSLIPLPTIQTSFPVLTIAQIKMQFVDREIFAAYETAEFKAMKRTGAVGMTLVRRSMRWISGRQLRYPAGNPRAGETYVYYQPSDRGKPIHARRKYGHVRRYTFFWYDRYKQSVIIGPAYLTVSKRTFRSSKTVPQIHEEGGSADVLVNVATGFGRQSRRLSLDWRRSTYVKRPFIEPNRPKTQKFFRSVWKDSMTRKGLPFAKTPT